MQPHDSPGSVILRTPRRRSYVQRFRRLSAERSARSAVLACPPLLLSLLVLPCHFEGTSTSRDAWIFDVSTSEDLRCECSSSESCSERQSSLLSASTDTSAICRSLWDGGCDCTLCSDIPSCSCKQPPPYAGFGNSSCAEAGGDEDWHVEGGGVCTPLCPEGLKPVPAVLPCKLGTLLPSGYQCFSPTYEAPPPNDAVGITMSFVDHFNSSSHPNTIGGPLVAILGQPLSNLRCSFLEINMEDASGRRTVLQQTFSMQEQYSSTTTWTLYLSPLTVATSLTNSSSEAEAGAAEPDEEQSSLGANEDDKDDKEEEEKEEIFLTLKLGNSLGTSDVVAVLSIEDAKASSTTTSEQQEQDENEEQSDVGWVAEVLYSTSEVALPTALPRMAMRSGGSSIEAYQNQSLTVDRAECGDYSIRPHCSTRALPANDGLLRLVAPSSIATLSATELLIADPYLAVTPVGPDTGTSLGAVLLLDLVEGSLGFACPTCCADDLLAPEAVRVAPSGTFWIVVDSGNAAVRKVEVATGKMTVLAGWASGGSSVESCRQLPAESKWRDFHVSQDVEIEDALQARLCLPSDASIHLSETLVLIAERANCQEGSSARVRLLDLSSNLLQRVMVLDDTGLEQRVGTLVPRVEWMDEDRFVAAVYGGFYLGSRSSSSSSSGGWTTTTLLDSTPPSSLLGTTGSFLAVVRSLPYERFPLVVLTSSGGIGDTVVEADLLSSSESNLLAGSGSVRPTKYWRYQGSELFLSNVSIAVGPFGETFLATSSWSGGSLKTSILRLLPAGGGCSPGEGLATQLSPGEYNEGCQTCSAGTFNNGSFVACQSCDSFGVSSAEGAAACTCQAGYYMAGSADSCLQCEEDYYCLGGESEAEVCPFSAVTFEALDGDASNSSNATSQVSLLLPKATGASSSEQCDCCYGSCRRCHLDGSCQSCPTGFWCAGVLAAPSNEARLKNGYSVDLDGSSGRSFDLEEAPWQSFRCGHQAHCWWASFPSLWLAAAHEVCANAAVAEASDCQATHCAGLQVGGSLTKASFKCASNREGLACGRCKVNFYARQSHINGDCEPCGNMPAKLLLTGLCWIFLLALLQGVLIANSPVQEKLSYGLLSTISVLIQFWEQFRLLSLQPGTEAWAAGQWEILIQLMNFRASGLLPFSSQCLVGSSMIAQRGLFLAFLAVLPFSATLLRFAALPCSLAATVARRLGLLRRKTCPTCAFSPAKNWDSTVNLACLIPQLLAWPLIAEGMNFFQCYSHPEASSSSSSSSSSKLLFYSLWSRPDILCFSSEWWEALPLEAALLLFELGWIALQLYLLRGLPSVLHSKNRSMREDRSLERQRWLWCRSTAKMLSWDLSGQARFLALAIFFSTDYTPGVTAYWFQGLQLYMLLVSNMYSMVIVVTNPPHNVTTANAVEFLTALTMEVAALQRMALLSRVIDYQDTLDVNVSGVVAVGGGIVVLGYLLYVLFIASRDLYNPKRASRDDTLDTREFVKQLLNVCEHLTLFELRELVKQVSGLPGSSRNHIVRLLRAIDQVLAPPGVRNLTRHRTRICGYDLHTGKINQELDENWISYGSRGSNSILRITDVSGLSASKRVLDSVLGFDSEHQKTEDLQEPDHAPAKRGLDTQSAAESLERSCKVAPGGLEETQMEVGRREIADESSHDDVAHQE